MDTLEKAELTTSIRHIWRLKPGMPAYNSKVLDMAGRKTERRRRRRKTRRRTQAIAKGYAFHANSITLLSYYTICTVTFVLYLSYFMSSLYKFFMFVCSLHYFYQPISLAFYFFSLKVQNIR